MADTIIPSLPAKAAPVAADTTNIVDSVGGADKKITLGTVKIDGDVTGTLAAATVSKVNGASLPASKTVVGTDGDSKIIDATASVLLQPTPPASQEIVLLSADGSTATTPTTSFLTPTTGLEKPTLPDNQEILLLGSDGSTATTPTTSFLTPAQVGGVSGIIAGNGVSTIAAATSSNLDQILPTQTGNGDKVLGTNGTTASWVDQTGGSSLPDQTGHDGEFLTTNGSTASWGAPEGTAIWGGITGTLGNQADLSVALGAKAPTASPTFTGTVSGITAAMVGAGPSDAKYLTGQAESGLSAEISLGGLANGTIPKIATSAGVVTGVSAASAGTDYAPATSGTAILKGNNAGGFSSASAGTDYVAPGGALGTPASGTLTNCTFPTLNQNTTGTAAHGTTWGQYAAISGPAQARTFTLPNADATLLYSGGALGTPSGGTLTNCSFPTLNQNTSGTAANLSGTPTLPNGTAATTQSQSDNSTKLATTAYVDTGLGTKAGTGLSYITAGAEGTLSGEVSLGALTTGILKHTVSGSVSTPATAGKGDADLILPDQATNNGKYLKTDGTNASWATPTASAAWGSITGTLSAQTDLDTALSGKQAAFGAGTTPTATEVGYLSGVTSAIQTQLNAKAGTITPTPADHSYSGTAITMDNGESSAAIAFGDVCYVDSAGKAKLANNDAVTHCPAMVVCVSASVAAGDPGTFLLYGFLRDDSWSTLTMGAFAGTIWLANGGASGSTWTQTEPTTAGQFVQNLGFAIAAKVWLFNPTPTLIEIGA